MRKPFLILNIILIVIQLNAQEQIVFQGTLKDSVNNIPIDYANIGIAHKNIGTISDDKGLFKLSIPKSFINDTITFSRIGYATKHLSINELLSQSNNTIVLKPKISTIREVNISSKKLKKKFRGNQTESHSIVLSCTSSPKN
jgi:hypothetical protein